MRKIRIFLFTFYYEKRNYINKIPKKRELPFYINYKTQMTFTHRKVRKIYKKPKKHPKKHVFTIL